MAVSLADWRDDVSLQSTPRAWLRVLPLERLSQLAPPEHEHGHASVSARLWSARVQWLCLQDRGDTRGHLGGALRAYGGLVDAAMRELGLQCAPFQCGDLLKSASASASEPASGFPPASAFSFLSSSSTSPSTSSALISSASVQSSISSTAASVSPKTFPSASSTSANTAELEALNGLAVTHLLLDLQSATKSLTNRLLVVDVALAATLLERLVYVIFCHHRVLLLFTIHTHLHV